MATGSKSWEDHAYHSNQSLIDPEAVGVRSYISEPERVRRNWKENPEALSPQAASVEPPQAERSVSRTCGDVR